MVEFTQFLLERMWLTWERSGEFSVFDTLTRHIKPFFEGAMDKWTTLCTSWVLSTMCLLRIQRNTMVPYFTGFPFYIKIHNVHKIHGTMFFFLNRSDGTVLSAEWGDKLMALVISIVEAYKDEMKVYQGSLGDFILEKYRSALRTDEFKDVDANVCQQFLEFFHKYENSIEASDTWFETSCKGYCEYWDCDGDRLLNWKDRGYRTVFDLLMVSCPDVMTTHDD